MHRPSLNRVVTGPILLGESDRNIRAHDNSNTSRSAVPCWRRASNAASSKHHQLERSTTQNFSVIKELIGARGVSKHSVETMVGSCKLRMSFVHRASSLLAQQAQPAKRGTGMESCKQAGSDVTVGHASPRQLPARGVLISTRLHTPASRQPARKAVQHMHVAVVEVVVRVAVGCRD